MALRSLVIWTLALVVFTQVLGECRSIARQDDEPGLLNLVQVPRACGDACTPIVNIIGLCPDLKCLCTTDNEDLYRGCINCIVAVKPNRTVIAQGQNTVEQFAANCNQNGVPIPIQTVSGFTGVVGTPTSSVSGTRLLSTSVARFSTTNLHTTSPTGLMTPLPSGSGSVAASGGSVSESVGSTSLTAPLSVPTGPGILSTSGISSGSDLSTSSGSSTASGPSTSATSPTQSQNGGTSVFKKGSFDVASKSVVVAIVFMAIL